MRIQGHVALGICASAVKLAVTGNRNGLWPFLLANLLIDVDHVPSYLRGWGIANPLDYVQFGVFGRIVAGKRSGLTLKDIGRASRPLHSAAVLGTVSLIAFRYSTLRPIAAGMLFHRAADWIAERDSGDKDRE